MRIIKLLVLRLPIHPRFLVLDIHPYNLFPSSTIQFLIGPLHFSPHKFCHCLQWQNSGKFPWTHFQFRMMLHPQDSLSTLIRNLVNNILLRFCKSTCIILSSSANIFPSKLHRVNLEARDWDRTRIFLTNLRYKILNPCVNLTHTPLD